MGKPGFFSRSSLVLHPLRLGVAQIMSFSWPYSMAQSLGDRSYTCNSDQNVSVEHELILFKSLNLPPRSLMSWNCLALAHYPCPVCWVCHLACPNGFTWCLTQHNARGLDDSTVHENSHLVFIFFLQFCDVAQVVIIHKYI
jgi:hypothetical protein